MMYFYCVARCCLLTEDVGPLHGGANEAAMDLISQFPDPNSAEQGVWTDYFFLYHVSSNDPSPRS